MLSPCPLKNAMHADDCNFRRFSGIERATCTPSSFGGVSPYSAKFERNDDHFDAAHRITGRYTIIIVGYTKGSWTSQAPVNVQLWVALTRTAITICFVARWLNIIVATVASLPLGIRFFILCRRAQPACFDCTSFLEVRVSIYRSSFTVIPNLGLVNYAAGLEEPQSPDRDCHQPATTLFNEAKVLHGQKTRNSH